MARLFEHENYVANLRYIHRQQLIFVHDSRQAVQTEANITVNAPFKGITMQVGLQLLLRIYLVNSSTPLIVTTKVATEVPF